MMESSVIPFSRVEIHRMSTERDLIEMTREAQNFGERFRVLENTAEGGYYFIIDRSAG